MRNTIYLLIVGFWLVFCGYVIYEFYFEDQLKSRKVINEILTMQVDSIKDLSTTNNKYYYIYFESKYEVTLDITESRPFRKSKIGNNYLQISKTGLSVLEKIKN